MPEVGVWGAPDIGTPLLEASEGDDVEVAEADIDIEVVGSGSIDDSVVGNDDVDEPLTR